jgi:hypothetical protein
MFLRRVTVAIAGLTALSMVASACGGGDDDDGGAAGAVTTTTAVAPSAAATQAAPQTTSGDAKTFVGAVEGTPALVAVQTTADGVSVFYCDSASLWGFLDGTLSGNALAAEDPAGTTLAATLDGDTVTGTLTLDGVSHPFTAEAATSDAGAYFAEATQGDVVSTTAWVRDNSGSVTGAKFNVDLAVLNDLPQFTREEQAVINQILETGIVGVPPDGTVPANAQPLSFGGAIQCGIAAFKFKRAQNRFNRIPLDTETIAQTLEFNAAVANLNTACGTTIGTLA